MPAPTRAADAGETRRPATEMSLFMTVNKDIRAAAGKLGLSLEAGLDTFDEYVEAHGTIDLDGTVAGFCLFSYRPDYKHTFSVGSARDAVVRNAVLAFLAENLGLLPPDVIFTDKNGFDISSSPVQSFLWESSFFDQMTLADALVHLRTAEGQAQYYALMDKVIDAMGGSKTVGGNAEDFLRRVRRNILGCAEIDDIRSVVETARAGFFKPKDQFLTTSFRTSTDPISSSLAMSLGMHELSEPSLLGAVALALFLMGFEDFLTWSRGPLHLSRGSKDIAKDHRKNEVTARKDAPI